MPSFEWQHTLQDMGENHDPVPVRASDTGNEIVGRCDFCNNPGPTWTYPCGDFTMSIGPFDRGFVGDWAACEDCHRDIERGRWSAVSARNAKRAPAGTRNGTKASVELLHRQFQRNRKGEPYRNR